MSGEAQYGLAAKFVEQLCGVFATFPKISEVILYGSRAKGNYKRGSDIDLALKGEALSWQDLGRIDEAVDDLLLPYEVDLLHYDTLEHAKLREHISRVGVSFYQRDSAVGYSCDSCGRL